MLADELIVCFGVMSWDFLWQRHQALMTCFAEAGNRVLYIEPIGIRMPKWEDRHRLAARVRNRQKAGARGIRPLAKNIWGLDPLVNPFQEVGAIHRRNVAALTARVGSAIAELGGDEPIIWTNVPTPLARETIARLPHRLLVYDCMDALTENPKGVMASFAESERALSRAADLVIVSAPTMLERQRELNPHTYLIPHGADYALFTTENGLRPEAAALAKIPHPRLVFFGGIDERVDLELVQALARHPSAWQIVLLGVARTDLSAVTALPNVHFIGQVPHDELPAYLHHCDVLILPYRRIGFSHYMNPAKLPECLAVGKPIVATDLPVYAEYDGLVSVASSRAEFVELVEQALAEGDAPTRVEERRAWARQNTWQARFEEICARMEERLARGELERGG